MGLRLVGTQTRVCQSDETWSSSEPSCEGDHLFPFGASVGDQIVPRADDGSSSAIPGGCRFLGVQEDTLFISTNGVLSFRNSFTDFSPDAFPLSSQSDVLLTPFWDDSDTTAGGQISYRFSNDQSLLDEIATNISDAFKVDFSPVTAFIATWNELPQVSGPIDVVNTFQAVLTTDGSSTYAIFLYRDIQWGDSGTSVGFNAGDGIRGFNLPESSTTEGILNLESSTNVGEPGVFCFRVDQQFIRPPPNIGVSLIVLNDVETVLEPDSGEFVNITACFSASIEEPLQSDAVFEFILSITRTTAVLGLDFIPQLNSPFLVIPSGFSGEYFSCVDVTIIGDNEVEEDEIVVYNLIPLSDNDRVIFPSNSSDLVIIIINNDTDVDTTVIVFEEPLHEVIEDIGNDYFAVRVCINISNLTTERSVRITTVPGTAQGEEDYEDLIVEVPIRFGVARKCVGISILEDTEVEEDETFQVIIEELGISTNVKIVDDDMLFRFVDNTPFVRGNTVRFNLVFGGIVTGAQCAVRGRQRDREDCSEGTIEFTSRSRNALTPRITLSLSNGTEIEIADPERRFRLGVNRRCGAHLINDGVTVVRNSIGELVNMITWALSGPNAIVEEDNIFSCSLDNGDQFDCETPYLTSDLEAGEHSLEVRPTGNPNTICRANLRATFTFTAP